MPRRYNRGPLRTNRAGVQYGDFPGRTICPHHGGECMRESWRTPAGRGFIMLAVMSAAIGFAVNAHTNIQTNYFDEVLHLSGPEFGYITAVREVGGFVLIFLTALFYRISLQ